MRADMNVIEQSHKSFRTKQKLAKAQKQNRPIPQWIRLRTGNTIRYAIHLDSAILSIRSLQQTLRAKGWDEKIGDASGIRTNMDTSQIQRKEETLAQDSHRYLNNSTQLHSILHLDLRLVSNVAVLYNFTSPRAPMGLCDCQHLFKWRWWIEIMEGGRNGWQELGKGSDACACLFSRAKWIGETPGVFDGWAAYVCSTMNWHDLLLLPQRFSTVYGLLIGETALRSLGG